MQPRSPPTRHSVSVCVPRRSLPLLQAVLVAVVVCLAATPSALANTCSPSPATVTNANVYGSLIATCSFTGSGTSCPGSNPYVVTNVTGGNPSFTSALKDELSPVAGGNAKTSEIRLLNIFRFRNAQGTYTVTVKPCSDATTTFTLTISDFTSATFSPSTATIDENTAANTNVATLTTSCTSPGFSIISQSTSGLFKITGDKLQVNNAALLDYETIKYGTVSVNVTGTNCVLVERTINVTLNNVVEPPTGIKVDGVTIVDSVTTINMNEELTTASAQFTAVTQEAGTVTYTLLPLAGQTDCTISEAFGNCSHLLFDITVDNRLQPSASAISSRLINYESEKLIDVGRTFTVCVQATQGGLSIQRLFKINVLDVPEAPRGILVSGTLPENSATMGMIGYVTCDDDEKDATLTATGFPTDANIALVVNSTAAVGSPYRYYLNKLTAVEYDFETSSPYSWSMAVTCVDSGSRTLPVGASPFTFFVTNVNEAPSALRFTSGNPSARTTINVLENLKGCHNLDIVDPDVNLASGDPSNRCNSGTYPFCSNSFQLIVDDPDRFYTTTTPSRQLCINATLDFETTPVVNVSVQVSDAGGGNNNFIMSFILQNVNEPPSNVVLSATSFDENVPGNTLVAILSAVDPDVGDTIVFAVNDTANFVITNSVELRTAASASFDYETKSVYYLRITVTDSGPTSVDFPVIITVNNVNEPVIPVAITLNGTGGVFTDSEALPPTQLGVALCRDPENEYISYTVVEVLNRITSATSNSVTAIQNLLYFQQPVAPGNYSLTVRCVDSLSSQPATQTVNFDVVFVNRLPTSCTLSPYLLPEDKIAAYVVGTISCVDPDGDALTYALDTVASSNRFVLCNGNQICVSSIVTASANRFDYESGAGDLSVTVLVTDASGTPTPFALDIELSNVNEAPTFITTSGLSVTRTTGISALVGTLSTIDPDFGDSWTYTLLNTFDYAYFSLSGSQVLSQYANFDFITKPNYTLQVTTTDAEGLSLTQLVTVYVTESNNIPTGILLSANTVQENSPVGTVIGSLSTVDRDNRTQTYAYTLLDSASNVFRIVGDQLQVNLAVLNFESVASYRIAVKTTDSGTPPYSFDAFFDIALTNQNEPPQNVYLTSTTVAENSPSNTVVGTLSSDDPDAGAVLTYSVVGVGNSSTVFGCSGNQLIVTGGGLDFEMYSSYQVSVRVSDGTLSAVSTFTITVTNVNEAPTDIVRVSGGSVSENSAQGVEVATFQAIDPDRPSVFLFALDDSAEGFFTMASNVLRVAKAGLDYERNTSMTITLRATDLGGAPGGLSVVRQFVITILNVNEQPAPTLSVNSVNERSPVGTEVGVFSANDPDNARTVTQTHTFALLNDQSTGAFTVTTDGKLLVARAGISASGYANSQITVQISVTDSGSPVITFITSFVITIINVNDAPTRISFSASSVPENAPANYLINTFSTSDLDPEDTHTYTLINDTCNAFAISGSALIVRPNATIDYEAHYPDTSCVFAVRSTDSGTPPLSVERIFTIAITDVNEAPTGVLFTPFVPLRENEVNTIIGNLTCLDPDRGQTFKFSIIVNPGTDSYFVIVDTNKVQIKYQVDYELNPFVAVQFQCTDSGTPPLAISQTVNLNVTNVNEQPANILLSNMSIPETAAVGTVVGKVTVDDPDVGDTFIIELMASANGRFRLENATGPGGIVTNLVVNATLLTAARDRSARVTIRATDSGGLFRTLNFDLALTYVNLPPTGVSITVGEFSETIAVGTYVGTLIVADMDAGQNHTCTLVDNDSGTFSLVNNDLYIASVATIDYEAAPTHSVKLMCTDNEGLGFATPQTLVLSVRDVNEAGLSILPNPTAVLETLSIGDVVAVLSTLDDPETSQSHTYAITSPNCPFTITAFGPDSSNLRLAQPLNFDLQPSVSCMISSIDDGWPPAELPFNLTIGVIDVNPCLLPAAGNCGANAICQKAGPGRSSCVCTEGYVGDGLTCSLIPVGESIECIAPRNRVSCNKCQVGFQVSSSSDQCGLVGGVKFCTRACVDVDECLRTDNGPCCSELTCENRDGYYSCTGFAVQPALVERFLTTYPETSRSAVLCALATHRTHNETNFGTLEQQVFGDDGAALSAGAIAGIVIALLIVAVIVALVVLKRRRAAAARKLTQNEEEQLQDPALAAAVIPKTQEEKLLEKARQLEAQHESQRQAKISANLAVFDQIARHNATQLHADQGASRI